MEFRGTGMPLTREGLDRVCDLLAVAPAEVWAVITVETRGFGFLPDRRPCILFERHVFHARTGGRFGAQAPGISSRTPGGYAGGAAEYERLDEAMALDGRAALASASWGIGQVMGFNHRTAGFPTVEAMVQAMVQDEGAQLLAMASFLRSEGLDEPLRRHDWEAFARGYNGPEFRRNQYDTRLAAAHAKLTVMLPDVQLRSLQAALLYAGFEPGAIDGVPGRRTRSALVAFQESRGLPAIGDSDLGSTGATLMAAVFPDRGIAV